MKEFTSNLNYYCIDHQYDDKEFIYDELAFKVFTTFNLMSLVNDADYLLYLSCINLLNSYVKQKGAKLGYSFKSNLKYFLKSVINNNIDFIKISDSKDDKGNLIVINIYDIQFSFHNQKLDIDNIDSIIDSTIKWDGVKKQAIALSIYDKIINSGLEFSNAAYDGSDLSLLVNDYLEKYKNNEIDFKVQFRGDIMDEKLLNKYESFKDVKLPVPFWDDEREVMEYVYNMNISLGDVDTMLQIDSSLTNALGNVATTGFYYSFTSGYYSLPTLDDKVLEPKLVVGHTHAHSFDEVVESLYDFPESFSVSEDEEEFFSKQELNYLNRVQKYLLFLGLKDITLEEFDNRDVSRYLNVPRKDYLGLVTNRYEDEVLDKILNGDIRSIVFVSDFVEIYENEMEHDEKVLVMNSNYDIKACLCFNKTEVKTYGEVKDIYNNDELNDDDKVVVKYFDIVEKF